MYEAVEKLGASVERDEMLRQPAAPTAKGRAKAAARVPEADRLAVVPFRVERIETLPVNAKQAASPPNNSTNFGENWARSMSIWAPSWRCTSRCAGHCGS